MFKQEQILQIALITATIGIITLLFLSEQIKPQEIKIKDINNEFEGRLVKINAKVLTTRQAKQTLILQIYDGTGKIDAVRFNQTNFPSIQKNSFASFEGKIKTYKGKLQMVIAKVEKWN